MADQVPSKGSKLNSVSRTTSETLRLNDNERSTTSNPRKKTSFQITSVCVTVGSRTSNDGGDDSADDLDESHTDDISEAIDVSRDIENETPSYSEDTFSKDDVFFNASASLGTAPVIPTSSQYGLAILATPDNCESSLNPSEACSNPEHPADIHVNVPENVINLGVVSTKPDPEMRDIHTHTARHERFKVVKIESTEPFKRGRWVCMDYLDHSMSQPKPKGEPAKVDPNSDNSNTQESVVECVVPEDTADVQQENPIPAITTQNAYTSISPGQSLQSGVQAVGQSLPAQPTVVSQPQSLPAQQIHQVIASGAPQQTNIQFQPQPYPQQQQSMIQPVVMQPIFQQQVPFLMQQQPPQQYYQPMAVPLQTFPTIVAAGGAAPQTPPVQQQPYPVQFPASGAPPTATTHMITTPQIMSQQQYLGPPQGYQSVIATAPVASPVESSSSSNANVSTSTASSSVSNSDCSSAVPQQMQLVEHQPTAPPAALLESLAEVTAVVDQEINQGEESESASGVSAVAIDNKIEQAMDLVKSHLMFAVREEVEVLKEKIAELMERITQLEQENQILKASATQEVLAQLPPPASPPHQQPANPPYFERLHPSARNTFYQNKQQETMEIGM